ncbi:uncharacterized protein LOC132187590 [Corylus avellana]|uniref:uncharacterized protein LOC132187590 n=1 Tax=Corylus avellana TaxID=13451 RepID=UPI00286A32C2|nr:uncharacterized protein LOC132187590 [Corylus avellana]
MDVLTNRVGRSEIKPGDHIYTYRAVFTYSHHGIFVGGNRVVHFSPDRNSNSNSTWISSDSGYCKSAVICPSYPECGFRQPNSCVLRSCLDCFLGNGSLYRFEYEVSPSFFFAQVRGGTCSFAKSDPPEQVIHRALYLLQYGFGNYDAFLNNCEDFALYSKTGLQVADGKKKTGGQASSFLGVPWATIVSSPLKWLMPSPGVATVTAGIYCMTRYANDIGVRDDAIKVAVEDLAENMSWEAHEAYFVQKNSASIPILDGRNFSEWSEQVQFYLGVWDLDLALRTEKPLAITNSSSAEEKAIYKSWERSNRLSIMFMQMSIVNNIKSTLPECDSAKEFFKNVLRSVDKLLTGTLMAELTAMKFDGTRGMHEHIIEMTNLTAKLKALGMNVDEFLLVQFIFNSLPPQYELTQNQYNTHKDKWNVNELTSILVQEEARLKQQRYHSAHIVSQGAKKIELPEVNGPLQVIEVPEKKENNVIEPSKVNGPLQLTEVHEKRQNNVIEPPKANVPLQVSEVHEKRHNNVKCYFCKKFGHVQRNCYKRKAWFEKKRRPYNPDHKPE